MGNTNSSADTGAQRTLRSNRLLVVVILWRSYMTLLLSLAAGSTHVACGGKLYMYNPPSTHQIHITHKKGPISRIKNTMRYASLRIISRITMRDLSYNYMMRKKQI